MSQPDPKKFEIIRMYKSTAAAFYGITWDTMNRNIRQNNMLCSELELLGISPRAKHLTAAQLALIVKYLGAPTYAIQQALSF